MNIIKGWKDDKKYAKKKKKKNNYGVIDKSIWKRGKDSNEIAIYCSALDCSIQFYIINGIIVLY